MKKKRKLGKQRFWCLMLWNGEGGGRLRFKRSDGKR